MPAKSSTWSHGVGGPLKSLGVGLFIFSVGSWMAHWLTLRQAHGWLLFLDHALAGIAAGLMVLLYERQRQRALDTLRESEERFRLVANAAPVVIWTVNAEKSCDYVNKTWLDFTGRSVDAELGNGWTGSIHPEDLPRTMETYDQSIARREKFNMEYRVRRHDGEYCWFLDVGVPRFHEDGSFAGYIGVGVDVTERKNAEQTLEQANHALEEQTAFLQTRRELLQTFVKHVPAAVAMLDRDMRYLRVSERWCSDLSLDSANILGRSHYEVFPDLPERWKKIHRRCLAGETVRAEEDRWDRDDGTTTWLRWEVRPWQIRDGMQGGILIFSEDITERKRSEETLLAMSRKLVEAHEQERTRIGRELHDDIVQRLALVAIELGTIGQDMPGLAPEIRARIRKLRNETTEITNDVQSLSHELHSSKLEYLGIDGAARNFCGEFGARQKLEIDFQSQDVPALPTDISLSLFRVLQEALRNATKHSGVRHFEVRLWGIKGEIHLTVSDPGKGFDMEAAMRSTGLGLTSMQERVRFVGGELSIISKPMGGTTVHARVPLNASSDSVPAEHMISGVLSRSTPDSHQDSHQG